MHGFFGACAHYPPSAIRHSPHTIHLGTCGFGLGSSLPGKRLLGHMWPNAENFCRPESGGDLKVAFVALLVVWQATVIGEIHEMGDDAVEIVVGCPHHTRLPPKLPAAPSSQLLQAPS
jgi:hypothetical protein